MKSIRFFIVAAMVFSFAVVPFQAVAQEGEEIQWCHDLICAYNNWSDTTMEWKEAYARIHGITVPLDMTGIFPVNYTEGYCWPLTGAGIKCHEPVKIDIMYTFPNDNKQRRASVTIGVDSQGDYFGHHLKGNKDCSKCGEMPFWGKTKGPSGSIQSGPPQKK